MNFSHSNYQSVYYDQIGLAKPFPMQNNYQFPQSQTTSYMNYSSGFSLSYDPYNIHLPLQPAVRNYPSQRLAVQLQTPTHYISSTPLAGDDALRAESEEAESSSKNGKTVGKRGRPTKNPVWSFFHRLNEKNVQCTLCGKVVKSACATNMAKHMERHHQDGTSGETSSPNMLQPIKSSQLETATIPRNLHGNSWKLDGTICKRSRRTKHPVWDLFTRDSRGGAICILCRVAVRSPCSSNFMGHLNRHHEEYYKAIYERWVVGRNVPQKEDSTLDAPKYNNGTF